MAVVSAPSDLLIFLFIQDKPTELLTLNLQFFILLLSYALGCVFLCIHFVPQYFCITDGIQPQFQIIASEILCAWPLPFTSATSTSISLKTPLLYYVESLCCCHLVAKLCPNLCDPMNCSPPGSSFPQGFPRQEYWGKLPFPSPGFPGGSDRKESAVQETQVRSLSQEDPLEKGMTTHSSFLAWRIPWTEEPGGLQSIWVIKSRTRLSDQQFCALQGIFPIEGSNSCLLCLQLWQTDSLPLYHLGRPVDSLESESESRSVMSNTLQPYGLYSPWNSPGQNTGVGSLSLLQGLFPTQGQNPGLLHCRRILYQLSHKWILLLFSKSGILPSGPCCLKYITFTHKSRPPQSISLLGSFPKAVLLISIDLAMS